MEYGSIEREIHIEATPDVVFEVISRAEHLREWWPDEAALEPVPGGRGVLMWRGRDGAADVAEGMTVLEVDPPRRFVFRWGHQPQEAARSDNSYLVTFELAPAGTGTTLRLTETGFRERGWEVAVLEEAYRDHVEGWRHFLPRLEAYAAGLGER